jgi:hypothetical protein
METGPPGHDPDSEPPAISLRPTIPFEPTYWADAPPFSPPGPRDVSRVARRNANHSAYRTNGNSGV